MSWPYVSAATAAQLRKHSEAVLGGRVVCIDPATGSTSQPGYAVLEHGELVRSGVLKIDRRLGIARRLKALADQLLDEGLALPELLVVERLRGRMVHPHLHWAVGVIVATLDPEAIIELPIPLWKAVARADTTYAKSDEADACAFGQTVIYLVRGLDPTGSAPQVPRRAGAVRRRATGASGVRDTKRKGGSGRCRRKRRR